jgi:Flp pilus assembly protein TadB
VSFSLLLGSGSNKLLGDWFSVNNFLFIGLLASIFLALFSGMISYSTFGKVALLKAQGQLVWTRANRSIPGLDANLMINPKFHTVFMPFIGLVQSRRAQGSVIVDRWVRDTDQQLTSAGLQTSWDPVIGLAYRLMASLAFGISGTIASIGVSFFAPLVGLFLLVLVNTIGLPLVFKSIFKQKAKARISEIERRLPYALEFVAMTMQANAIVQVALEEYIKSAPPADAIAFEFRLLLRDEALGLGTKTAFSNFAKRIDSQPVRLFVSAVEQGIVSGQSMTKVLLEQAQAARVVRYQAAESLAKNAAVEAMVPLMLCLVSCLLALVVPMLAKFNIGG